VRPARWVEMGAWTLGVALLCLYAGARFWSEHAREDGIEAFRDARNQAVDQSLWSNRRVIAFAESAAAPGVPEGLLRIPSVQLEVPVFAGTSEINLNRGAGRIEGTAALSPDGNIGIAAHRDGFFRKLKDVGISGEIFVDVDDRTLRYRIVDISIVDPSDVHVLAATEIPSVTLVTCYPFYFLGNAPQRYIVRAELAAALPAAAEGSQASFR